MPGSSPAFEDLGPADHVSGYEDLGPADHAQPVIEDLGPADHAVSTMAAQHLATMNAQPLPATSGPPLGESAMQTSVGRRLVGAGRSAMDVLGGVGKTIGAVAQQPGALLDGRRLLDIAQQNATEPIEGAVRVGSAPFAPLTAAAGGLTEDVTGSPMAGDLAELGAGLGVGKAAPGVFSLNEKQPSRFNRPSPAIEDLGPADPLPWRTSNDPLEGGADWSPFGLSDEELAKVRPGPLDEVDKAERALRFAEKARNAPVIEDLGPADHVSQPEPIDLSPESLQAAIRLPNGSVKVTGRNHVLPEGINPDLVDRGFVGKDGKFLSVVDLEGKIRAGNGTGEHTIGQAEIAPADEATKAQAQNDFGLDLDALQRQADEASAKIGGDASLLRRGQTDNAGTPPVLADETRGRGEVGPAGQLGSASDALQDRGSAPVRGGREAGAGGAGREYDVVNGVVKDVSPTTAFRLKSGEIVSDPDGGNPLHLRLMEKLGLDPTEIESGGWVRDGEYVDGSADTGPAVARADAAKRVAGRRAARSAPSMDDLRAIREGKIENISDLSPEASERQRRLEELATPKEKKAPAVRVIQPKLQLSEDYGRKLDQQEISFDPAELEAAPAPNRLSREADMFSNRLEERPSEARLEAEQDAYYANVRRKDQEGTPFKTKRQIAQERTKGLTGWRARQAKDSASYKLGAQDFDAIPDERQAYLDSVAKMEAESDKGPDFGLRVKRSAGPDEPARFLNPRLAAKNLRSRHGMNQLGENEPESAFALRRAANAEGGTSFAVRDTADAVNKIEPGLWDKYKETKVEGALRDKVRQYSDLAEEVNSSEPEAILKDYESDYRRHLEGIQGSAKFSKQQPLSVADRAYAAGNAEALRGTLSDTFSDAAGQVSHVLPDDVYQSRRQSAEFKAADKIARQNLLDPAAEAHARNEGHISEYPGEEGYFPLSGKAPEGERRLFGLRRGGAYSKPSNPGNKYRTGLSEYDLSDEALSQKLKGAARSNETAAAIKQLEADGLIKKIPQGQNPPRTYDYRGQTYKAERVGDHVMPSWVRDEAAPVLENLRQAGVPEGQLRKLMHTIVQSNMKLGFDKVIHAKNEAGVLTSFAPTLGESKLSRTVGNLPVAKQFNAVGRVAARTLRDIPLADRPTVREMIANGEWTPRETESGKLSGMAKMDLAGRIEGRKAFQRWNPTATKQELYDFSTRFGEYNTQLASDLVRTVKKSPTFSPVSPFIVAGNTMRLNAIDSLMAGKGVPGGLSGKAAAAIGGGVPTAVALWVAAYKLKADKFPWEDPGVKIGQIPIGHEPDPKTGKDRTKYFNLFNAMNPMLARGSRATGLTGATETLARGGSGKQAAQQGIGDAINSLIHPILGPAARFWTRLVFGKEPSLQGTKGVWDAYKEPKTFQRNAKSAAEGLNPTVEMAVQTHEKSQGAWDAVLQKLGLISYENTVGHAKALKKEQADEARAEKKVKK